MHKGSCLCGAVRFTVEGDLAPPDACHCRECRKQTGHFLASCDVSKTNLAIADEAQLCWYRSSDKVRRGFCRACGSTLFWDPVERDWIGIAMGAFDGATGVRIAKHIFTAEKGDYYEIADGAPQHAR